MTTTENLPAIRCSTEQFHEVLHRKGFIRTSWTSGYIGEQHYGCATPPEAVPGYLTRDIEAIMRAHGKSEQAIARAMAKMADKPRPWWRRLLGWPR